MADKQPIDIDQQIKRTLKDTLIYAPANVLPAIVGILLIRVLTGVFSPEEYGHYQITLSTFGLIRIFSMIWLYQSVTRFYLEHKKQNQQTLFFSTLFICTLVCTLVVAGICWLINISIIQEHVSKPLFSLINISIAASIVSAFFETFIMTFRAGLEAKKYSLFWILFAVGKPLVGIALIFLFDFRVNGIFWGFFFVPLLLNCFIFRQLQLKNHLRIRSVSRSLIVQFVKYGVPISLSSFSFWILSLSDRYLIGLLRSSSDVGLYSVGYLISEKTLNFIYMILMLAAFPIIIDNWQKHGQEQTKRLITELTRYFFLICVPILTVLVTIPEQVLSIFSHTKFMSGAKVLPLIAIGVFLFGLNQYVLKGFELHKKSLNIAVLALTAGICNIVLNIILIPRLGFMGAGISACTAYLVYFVSSVLWVRKKMPWRPPYLSLIRIGIAAFVLAGYLIVATRFVHTILPTALCVIPAGGLLFFFILMITREIKKHEIKKGWDYLLSIAGGK